MLSLLRVYSIVRAHAVERYEKMKGVGPERLASGSDDFTLFLWDPVNSKKPLARMTGKRMRASFPTFLFCFLIIQIINQATCSS
jgi:hypothetical protein